MFSAFNSAQNMIAQLYDQQNEKNLGIISLLVLYLVFGISSLFAPNISAKFSPKWVMLFSSLGYTIFVACGILVSTCPSSSFICDEGWKKSIVIFGAFLCGLGASTLWVSQAWYISNISSIETRGLYYGIFWSFMQSSQILGNLLSFILLKYNHETYFITLTILCLVSGLSFSVLPQIEIKEEVKGFSAKMKEVINLVKKKEMVSLLFYFFFAGAVVAFYTGFLYKLVEQALPNGTSQKDINEKTAYVFICLGCFEFIGGMISGILADKQVYYSQHNYIRVNRYLIATASSIIVELAIVLSIICYYEQSYVLCFVTGALWGLSDCIIQNMCTILCSTLFPGSIEAFAINRIVQGFSIATMMLINIFLIQYIQYIGFILVLGGIEIITNLATSKIGVVKEK